MERKITNLEKSAKKDTAGMIFTVILYAVGAVSVPYIKVAEWLGGGQALEWYLAFAFKIICSALPVYLIFQFGMKDMITGFSGGKRGLLLCVPAFLVALDNFPFLPLITGSLKFVGSAGNIFPYVLYCLSIGVMEETIFRGNLLPLFMFKFSKDKKGTFWAVVVSSAIFGAMHLLNLLGGFSPMVFLQVGYSFLIGCMCAAATLFSGNIIVPIIIHALFDIGGFLTDYGFLEGTLWTTGNVVLTAVVSVIMATVIVVSFLKSDFSPAYERLNLNDTLKPESGAGDNA